MKELEFDSEQHPSPKCDTASLVQHADANGTVAAPIQKERQRQLQVVPQNGREKISAEIFPRKEASADFY